MDEWDVETMRLVEFFKLTEGASPILYHYTHTGNLEKILASQVEDGCDAEIDYLVEALG